MLRDIRNDLFHILGVLESIGKIEKYVNGIDSVEEFIETNDQLYYNATLTLLANIGETLSKLSDETQSKLNNIDFTSIRGMRNRIVHDYTGLDSYLIFETAKTKLKTIQEELESLADQFVSNGKFDKEELSVSVNDHFYRHVRFEKIQQANKRCN